MLVRFTDFLVYEVDLDGKVIHLKSLEKPESAKKDVGEATTSTISPPRVPDNDIKMDEPEQESVTKEKEEVSSTFESDHKAESLKVSANDGSWHEHFNIALSPFLSEEAILQVKNMYLEGREPPRVSDSGWAGRSVPSAADCDEVVSEATVAVPVVDEREGNDRSGGRGKRGGRGGRGGKGGRSGSSRVDHRKVLSNVSLATASLNLLFLNFELFSLSLPRKLVRHSIRSSATCLAESLTLKLTHLRPCPMKALGSLLSGEDKGADGQVEGVIQVSAPRLN